MDRIDAFWARVTEGMQVSELWSSFVSDARASYRLYSKDVDAGQAAGMPKGRQFFHTVGQFFWAVLEKLTPARRVLLLSFSPAATLTGTARLATSRSA